MKITEIMTRDIVVVGVNENLAMVKRLFTSDKFHHLLVVDKENIVGVISDRDLLKAISPFIGTHIEHIRDTETLNQKVTRIMSRPPIVLEQGASVMDAVSLFNLHAISCIPIIDDEEKPVGIVTWRDIFRAVLKRREDKSGGA
ncbi:MAG: CBS domain-containing protein [Gammaproteobacteria bacterium]|nr:CBS domain-containing protein [Gammaproteobacteria bacterium]